MASLHGGVRPDALERHTRRQLRIGSITANVAGGLVVFVLLAFVLPAPQGLHHATRLIVLNAVAFIVGGAIAVPLVAIVLGRLWAERFAWAASGRQPTSRERELALRFPLSEHLVIAATWGIGALIYAGLNAVFSAELAFNVAITIVLGGLVTCALGYLLAERTLRPITALVLATGVPSRPQLPGVAARALLSWTLGTGVILLGVALVALGGLQHSYFKREQLSVAVLVLSVVGIVAGFVTMVALARSLADPIDALRRAVGLVQQGTLDHAVAVDDASEVGLLQAGFNQMLAGLRERERLHDLFGRQVGTDVVSHALEHGVELGGEAREAAVLFVDVQESTKLAQTQDPTEVVSLLNAYFAIVVDVVSSHQGWVDKFEGDAALCVFGAPIPDPDAASHALAAARELGARLAHELADVRVGIGVSAGRVVAGNVGAASRFEYTVIGDPVNEASRLTELAKSEPSRVLVSEAALARANDPESAHWHLSQEVQLRGRTESTRAAVPLVDELL
jgi:adenylate cyclase